MRQIFDLYIYILYLSCHILHISALTQQYQSIYLSQHLKTFKLQNCVSLTRLLMICQSLVDLQTYKLLLYKYSVRISLHIKLHVHFYCLLWIEIYGNKV